MALSKLGDFIELVDNRNESNVFNASNVRGISTSKAFIDTKANLDNVSLQNYKVVNVGQFAYVADTSRRGEKIGLAYADSEPCIISSIYTVFKVKDERKLLPRYLMMFFNRSEFDRYARFNSWGSARETFSWDDFCDIVLEIPSIEIQRKYVAIYEGLLANLHSYERGLDDLKLVCDGYIENLKTKYSVQKIGPFLVDSTKKNEKNYGVIVGISKEQKLIPSDTRTNGVDKSKYLVLKNGDFAYSPIHINDGSIALNELNCDFIISPIYRTFMSKSENQLFSKYLMLWFARKEFIRYCWFHAFGSARDSFEWSQMCDIKIPLPPIKIQRDIADVFDSLCFRKKTIENLKAIIATICPVLIRGSIEESKGGSL